MANLIGTAGHVDHGKTSLVRALTGIDADRLPEEKARGLTIDIGFAHLDLPGVGRCSIVDVPGHERFLTNMLVGALGMDVVLLCVAADESVKPQTVEHLQIVGLLPVERMVVALTRCDLADTSSLERTKQQVAELLAPTRFQGSPLIETSAQTGQGLDELKRALAAAVERADSDPSHDWYLPVDRAFAVKGHGVVVTGTLAQGTVHEGDRAVLLPDGIEVRVRSIQCHDEQVAESTKGRRTALNLAGVRLEAVRRGQTVGTEGSVFATSVLDAQATWLEAPKHGARVRVSIGADEAIAKAFLSDLDPSAVQLRFERPIAAAKGQPLIVRQFSPPTLLGGGRVTVPQAKLRRRSAAPTTTVQGGSDEAAIVAVVGAHPGGLHNDELCRIVGKSAQALGGVLERLKSDGALLGFAGLWMTREQFGRASAAYAASLATLHERQPAHLMQAREAPLAAAKLDWTGKPLERLLARMAEEGTIRVQGTGVALASFKVELGEKKRAMLDRVTGEFIKSGLSAPTTKEVALALKVPPQAVEEIVRVGLAAGEFVHVGEGYDLPVRLVTETVAKARAALKDRPFSASEFREAVGTTRKYAIPFLEHLDAKGVTTRQGDLRVFNRP